MSVIEIRVQAKKDAAPLFPELKGVPFVANEVVTHAGVLEGGTQKGKTSVFLMGRCDGKMVALQLSAVHFELIAGVVRGAQARFGDDVLSHDEQIRETMEGRN